MGHNLCVSHDRTESDEKYMRNVKCSTSDTSKNAASPREPVKLMIQIDFCTKQIKKRIGSCRLEVAVQVLVCFTIC